MKKRSLSLLLAALVLLGAMSTPQWAISAGTLTLSNVSAPRGETVEVTVSLVSDDVCSGNFDICYDATTLKLVSAAPVLAFAVVNETTAGTVRVSFASTTVLTEAVLCRLTFRVTADTPAEGSPLTVERLRLYDADSALTTGSALSGSVSRDTAVLRLSDQITTAYQAVSLDVELAGALACAGGDFTVTYDPTCFEVRSVLSGDSAAGVSLSWNVVTPGTLRVAFSSAAMIPACTLCRVVLQTVTDTQKVSAVTLSDARMYDENSQPVDVTLTGGTVQIAAPSDRDPKLWVVGGTLDDSGAADLAVVFQGRNVACGGNFTLTLPENAAVTVADSSGSVQCAVDNGVWKVSWGSATPYTGEITLLTLRLTGGNAGDTVGFDSVRVYGEDGEFITADVRPCCLRSGDSDESVAAVIDEERTKTVKTDTGATVCTVAVDVASAALGENAVETVSPVLALYDDNGRLVALKTDTVSLSGGVGEVVLTAETAEDVAAARVFLLDGDGDYAPLCAAKEGGSAEG